MDDFLQGLSDLMLTSGWLAPLIALFAGVVTSLTPCSLSSIPLVIGYVGGAAQNDTKKSFKYSLVFSLGMAITYTALGVIVSLVGGLMGTTASWWYILLGVMMVLMALQTFEIYNFIPATNLLSKSTKRGYIGALIAGGLGGLFSSPCSTPVLIVLLGLVAGSGNVLWGIVLLLLYSIGHSVLVLIAGTSVGFAKKLSGDSRYGKFSSVLKYVLGSLILLIGFYMFYLGF